METQILRIILRAGRQVKAFRRRRKKKTKKKKTNKQNFILIKTFIWASKQNICTVVPSLYAALSSNLIQANLM